MAVNPDDLLDGGSQRDPSEALAAMLAAQGIEPPAKGQRLAFNTRDPTQDVGSLMPGGALGFSGEPTASGLDPAAADALRRAYAEQPNIGRALSYAGEGGLAPTEAPSSIAPETPRGPMAPGGFLNPTDTPLRRGGGGPLTPGQARQAPFGRPVVPQNPPMRSAPTNPAQQGPSPGIPQPPTPAPQAAQTPGDTTATEETPDDTSETSPEPSRVRADGQTTQSEQARRRPGGQRGPTGDNLAGLSKALSGAGGLIKPPPLQHLAPQAHLPGAPGAPVAHPLGRRGVIGQVPQRALAARNLGELLRGR
jgi:hypothetical protein